MNKLLKNILLWALALIVMLSAYTYQKRTGPTYPKKIHTEINGISYKFELPRSSDSLGNEVVKLAIPDKSVSGYMTYVRYKSTDSLTNQPMVREGDVLKAYIPHQAPAGKIVYNLFLASNNSTAKKITEESVIIRFKGQVPNYILLPHIFFIFFGMWFAVRTGIEAITKGDKTHILTICTVFLIFFGGLVLGPIMQKYAFDAYWTGWPFKGFLKFGDMTDNKTAVMFLSWVIAAWRMSVRKEQKWWAIVAMVITLVTFLIPHSILGSEIDHTQLSK